MLDSAILWSHYAKLAFILLMDTFFQATNAFPQPSKTTNPFDVINEPTSQAPTVCEINVTLL